LPCNLNQKKSGKENTVDNIRTIRFGTTKLPTERPASTKRYCVEEKTAPNNVVNPKTLPTKIGEKFRIANVVATVKKIDRKRVNTTNVATCSGNMGTIMNTECTIPIHTTMATLLDSFK
tara:strand:+ start:95 stop:451 length:357 start_codon:yes stop_codon:yes gene_type:complete